MRYDMRAGVTQGAELCKGQKKSNYLCVLCVFAVEKITDNQRPLTKFMEDIGSLSQFLTIHQVSQQLDVPKPTLRFWEREFEGILVPLRTNGGQRRYAPEHVSIIEEIKMLKKTGLGLIEIKRKLGKGIEDLLIGRFDDWEKGSNRGQMSGDKRTGGIDLLADRVAEAVRSEVLRFFQRGEG